MTTDMPDVLCDEPNEIKDAQCDKATELPKGKPWKSPVWLELRSLFIKIAIIAGVAALIFNFVYGFHYSEEPAMHPAVKDGDLVMFYRWDKEYRAGDLVLLSYQGRDQIRRVVATAGDTVEITEDGLKINGALQQEPEIYERTDRPVEGVDYPLTLAENEVFVLGDARENMTDSRIFGAINTEDTNGKIIAVLRRRSL